MKTSFVKGYNSNYYQNNIKSNQFFQNIEQFKSSNSFGNPSIYQSIFNQNQYKENTHNIAINTNQKNFIKEKKNNTIPLDKVINLPKQNTNIIPKAYFNPQKNLNPSHMKFNNGIKNINIEYASKSQEQHGDLKKSAVYQNNNNKNIYSENPRKKMGSSQMNFYTKNKMNLFPNILNIQNNNNFSREKENLYSINSNWMIYSKNGHGQQDIYNEFFNNMIKNNQRQILYKDNFMRIFDFEYKRKEEKLKKGQNQLILERLQKKYEAQIKSQNMHRTGVGFYHKNKNNNKRQRSAQDNNNNINLNQVSENNKKEPKSEFSKKNSINNMGTYDKERIQIDDNNSINNDRKFNKTYNTGFNLKKYKKERKKKEKLIFTKIFKYFTKRTKNNYLWVRYFNKKIKMRLKEEENETSLINKIHKKQKSLDESNLYPKLIKKMIRKNIIFKKTKIKIIKKENLKYNSDNSEIDKIKEYKRIQKKLKNKKSEYSHFININNNNKKPEKFENEYSSSSSNNNSFINKKEPQFRGLFDKDNKHNTNTNEPKEEKSQEKRNFNFRTTSNFFSKNNNFNEKRPEKNDNKKEQKYENSNNAERNKFNIENIINNVIENNKKAAAARSSTSFYNIGSNFMNNRMRSTKTNFYSSKDNKGGNFTGTKDSNFTKEQANEGRYYKPNSLKLTLINPLAWRKHEEIWGNLVSLKLGLSDLEKYLHPPNDTDVLVSSYLKMNPRILNFCSIQKINTSKTNNENNNFISFMIDDNIQNPKQEIKKWKEAYKRVIFRWHPDKLFHTLEEINFKNEQQKNELKKRSTQIINNMNTLYRNIIEILNKIADAKNEKDGNNN